MRSWTTGGGSTGRRSADAKSGISVCNNYLSLHTVRKPNIHFAPEPQALARSGCWITVNVYFSFLPPLVCLVIVSGMLLGPMDAAILESTLPLKWFEAMEMFRSAIGADSQQNYKICYILVVSLDVLSFQWPARDREVNSWSRHPV